MHAHSRCALKVRTVCSSQLGLKAFAAGLPLRRLWRARGWNEYLFCGRDVGLACHGLREKSRYSVVQSH
jgi:hypothetical protein